MEALCREECHEIEHQEGQNDSQGNQNDSDDISYDRKVDPLGWENDFFSYRQHAPTAVTQCDGGQGLDSRVCARWVASAESHSRLSPWSQLNTIIDNTCLIGGSYRPLPVSQSVRTISNNGGGWRQLAGRKAREAHFTRVTIGRCRNSEGSLSRGDRPNQRLGDRRVTDRRELRWWGDGDVLLCDNRCQRNLTLFGSKVFCGVSDLNFAVCRIRFKHKSVCSRHELSGGNGLCFLGAIGVGQAHGKVKS